MTAVYKSAVKELKLESAPAIEHERLATCILSIGHSHSNKHRLLESSVRLYIVHTPRHAMSPAAAAVLIKTATWRAKTPRRSIDKPPVTVAWSKSALGQEQT